MKMAQAKARIWPALANLFQVRSPLPSRLKIAVEIFDACASMGVRAYPPPLKLPLSYMNLTSLPLRTPRALYPTSNVYPPASERRGDLKGSKDFYLKAKARIWP